MARISVAIITLNEARNMERCLRSVQHIADEIVVIDSFSTDETASIAERFGARIVLQKFLGYLEQKNFAAAHSANDWVFSIDADEVLSPELEQEILKLKSSLGENGISAYRMSRLNNYCGQWIKHCGWYPDKKIRLYNRKAGEWKGENPHDRWELHNRSDKTGELKGDLLHYSFYTIAEHEKKIEKYSEIAARQRLAKGINYSIVKVKLAPAWKFFKDYVLRLGFMDGTYGYTICKLQAKETRLKYNKVRLYNKWKKQGKDF